MRFRPTHDTGPATGKYLSVGAEHRTIGCADDLDSTHAKALRLARFCSRAF